MLPRLAAADRRAVERADRALGRIETPLVGTPVSKFEHLMKRVDPQQVEAMIEESKQEAPATDRRPSSGGVRRQRRAAGRRAAGAEHCTIDEFVKVDLRVARVVAAEDVPEANKLLQLTLSLGGDERRNVFAGIKGAYKPEELVGRLVICAANLAPRKMKFGISEGMVLAAGAGGKEIFLLNPDSGAAPGMRVH